MTRFDHRARVPCIIDEHNGKEGGGRGEGKFCKEPFCEMKQNNNEYKFVQTKKYR